MVLKDILTAVIVLLLMVIIKNWINHWLSSENLVSVRVICGGGVFIFICFSSRYVGSVLVHRWRSSAVPGSGKPIIQRSND